MMLRLFETNIHAYRLLTVGSRVVGLVLTHISSVILLVLLIFVYRFICIRRISEVGCREHYMAHSQPQKLDRSLFGCMCGSTDVCSYINQSIFFFSEFEEFEVYQYLFDNSSFLPHFQTKVNINVYTILVVYWIALNQKNIRINRSFCETGYVEQGGLFLDCEYYVCCILVGSLFVDLFLIIICQL